MVSQGHRRSVGSANATLGAEDQELRLAQVGRVPAHGRILRPTEYIAAGRFAQPIGLQGQMSGRARRMSFNRIQILTDKIVLIFIHG